MLDTTLTSLLEQRSKVEKELNTLNKAIDFINKLTSNSNGNGNGTRNGDGAKRRGRKVMASKPEVSKKLRVFTEEHKAKIKAAQLARWERVRAQKVEQVVTN